MAKQYRTDLIAPPSNKEKYFGDVDTKGIIDAVLFADPHAAAYTKKFAPTLKGRTLLETCRNVWEFVKTQIPYVLDPLGEQYIKSPGRLWRDKAGDCKSFSIFTGSILRNLGIPYGYRFASYDDNDPTPTHVYVYVPVRGGEVIIDAVWKGAFNTQKDFYHKQDFIMSRTYYLGSTDGMGNIHQVGELRLPKNPDELTVAEMDLLLAKQEAEIRRLNKGGIAGIDGPTTWEKTLDHCIRNIDEPDTIMAIGEALEEGGDMYDALEGLGKTAKKAAKQAKRAEKKKTTGKTAAGRFLKKVATGVKKAGKAVVKVATAPLRLIAKGAMEIYIPKAAPFFLYLFAPADKLPDLMKRKRQKAERFKNTVVKGLGMKEDHFMKIVRNALLKKLKMDPETFLAQKLATKVSGIAGLGGNWKATLRQRNGGKLPTMRPGALKRNIKPTWNSTWNVDIAGIGSVGVDSSMVTRPAATSLLPGLAPRLTPNITSNKALELATQKNAGSKVLQSLSSGNIIAAAIQAIGWLISKIAGGKGETITAADFPDVERDAANAFEFQDLQNSYPADQQPMIKEVATELITSNAPLQQIVDTVKNQLPFLDSSRQQEIVNEVAEGAEPIDTSEASKLANEIQPGAGKDNTGLLILGLGVAALAFSK